MKYCMKCPKKAVFIVQWGAGSDQKEYSCEDCLSEVIRKIKAIEFYVVKVSQIETN